MPLVGPHRKPVPEAHVYTYGRYGDFDGHGYRDRHVYRKNRGTRRWKKRQAAYLRPFRKCGGIDPTKPIPWTVHQFTYTPSP